MLTYFLMLLASWLYVTVMHEVSHVLVAKYDGATKVRIYPYPHKYEGKFYFARYSYEGIEYKGPGNLIDSAPLFMNFVTTVIALSLSLGLAPTNLPFYILSCAAVIDSFVWIWGCWLGGGPHTDGYKFRHGYDK